jgi:hypothetical protein
MTKKKKNAKMIMVGNRTNNNITMDRRMTMARPTTR